MGREEWVLDRWTSLCSDLGIASDLSITWGNILRDSYIEEGRFYHTLEHVADMLEGADRDFRGIKQPCLVKLAIFFHDVVYNPKSSSNEEDSEVMFREFSEAVQMRPVDADTVSSYIIATKEHDVIGADDPDLHAFIDLDMAVLGREPVAYLAYASQIREEYKHVPTNTYCEKRAEVLRSFLTKPIFATDIYRRELEAVARANLEAEIALLSARTIPSTECRSAYHKANTEKCLKCSEPVAPKKDKFSGTFFELEGKGRVHAECYEQYTEETADRCLVCKQAIRKKEWFSGDFMLFEAGKVHKECASEYEDMMADKCLYCEKGVRKTANFSGAFYLVNREPDVTGDDRDPDVERSNESQEKVHMECFEPYQASLASNP